jgi:hypothetical protein
MEQLDYTGIIPILLLIQLAYVLYVLKKDGTAESLLSVKNVESKSWILYVLFGLFILITIFEVVLTSSVKGAYPRFEGDALYFGYLPGIILLTVGILGAFTKVSQKILSPVFIITLLIISIFGNPAAGWAVVLFFYFTNILLGVLVDSKRHILLEVAAILTIIWSYSAGAVHESSNTVDWTQIQSTSQSSDVQRHIIRGPVEDEAKKIVEDAVDEAKKIVDDAIDDAEDAIDSEDIDDAIDAAESALDVANDALELAEKAQGLTGGDDISGSLGLAGDALGVAGKGLDAAKKAKNIADKTKNNKTDVTTTETPAKPVEKVNPRKYQFLGLEWVNVDNPTPLPAGLNNEGVKKFRQYYHNKRISEKFLKISTEKDYEKLCKYVTFDVLKEYIGEPIKSDWWQKTIIIKAYGNKQSFISYMTKHEYDGFYVATYKISDIEYFVGFIVENDLFWKF